MVSSRPQAVAFRQRLSVFLRRAVDVRHFLFSVCLCALDFGRISIDVCHPTLCSRRSLVASRKTTFCMRRRSFCSWKRASASRRRPIHSRHRTCSKPNPMFDVVRPTCFIAHRDVSSWQTLFDVERLLFCSRKRRADSWQREGAVWKGCDARRHRRSARRKSGFPSNQRARARRAREVVSTPRVAARGRRDAARTSRAATGDPVHESRRKMVGASRNRSGDRRRRENASSNLLFDRRKREGASIRRDAARRKRCASSRRRSGEGRKRRGSSSLLHAAQRSRVFVRTSTMPSSRRASAGPSGEASFVRCRPLEQPPCQHPVAVKYAKGRRGICPRTVQELFANTLCSEHNPFETERRPSSTATRSRSCAVSEGG
jgi:hypothetical protein